MNTTLDFVNTNSVIDIYLKVNNVISVTALIYSFASIQLSYYMLDKVLDIFNHNYSTLPFFRKRYVVKNFVKGIYIVSIALACSSTVFDGILNNNWNNYLLATFGYLYWIPDLVALVRVPKMQKSTILHHLTVGVFSTINIFNDYTDEDSDVWRGMIIYAYMSTLTGIVNFYLAFRIVVPEEYNYTKRYVAGTAFITYALSLAINWSYQLYIIMKWIVVFPMWGLYVYLVLLYFIIYDDIILASFLWKDMKIPKLHKLE